MGNHLPGLKESEPPDSFRTIKGGRRLGEALGIAPEQQAERDLLLVKHLGVGLSFPILLSHSLWGLPSALSAVTARPWAQAPWEGGLSVPLPLCT